MEYNFRNIVGEMVVNKAIATDVLKGLSIGWSKKSNGRNTIPRVLVALRYAAFSEIHHSCTAAAARWMVYGNSNW